LNPHVDLNGGRQPRSHSENKTKAAHFGRLFLFGEPIETDLAALMQANTLRWNRAKSTRDFALVAKCLAAAKPRLPAVAMRTGVPWFVIAEEARSDAVIRSIGGSGERCRHGLRAAATLSTPGGHVAAGLFLCPGVG
jgi:hypothetical protein